MKKMMAIAVMAGLLAAAGCGKAKIDDMVAGGDLGRGDLGCWLMLEFKSYPDAGDPRDVVVRFHSEALDDTPEFDWEYIASKDVIQKESGWGHDPNRATTPGEPPPLGQIIKIRFPLNARQRIMKDEGALWLNAELSWAGELQDTAKDDIRRVYQREDGTGRPGTM